ncbi:Do family serine endopeptidase [Verrucomicrobiales bacterium]|nr:Do family serine endopeptidase [Verrucomicrobiales bacterium]
MKTQTTQSPILAGLAVAATLGFTLTPTFAADSFQDKVTIDNREIDRDSPAPRSYAKMLSKVSPAVVSVHVTSTQEMNLQNHPLSDHPMFRDLFEGQDPRKMQPRRSEGIGSGVIVSEDGYIITNNHVVSGADEVTVEFAGGRKRFVAEVIGTDPRTDIAVLKVKTDEKLPTIPISDSGQLKVGDVVMAIGSPLEYDQTVTQGIVSAIGRENVGVLRRIGGYENFIQVDAPINQGNSGGALIDTDGRLVGINTAIASQNGGSVGIGFAIPTNMALTVAEALVDDGEVLRGFLGVYPKNLDDGLASALGLDEPEGALVAQVSPGTPADKAGFKFDDVVTKIGDIDVDDAETFRRLVGNNKPGTEIEFTIVRDTKTKTLTAELGEIPDDSSVSARPMKRNKKSGEDFLEGVDIVSLDKSIRSQLELSDDVDGVIVSAVEPNSQADLNGLSAGDVIVSVGREPIGSVDEAVEARDAIGDSDYILLRVLRQGSESTLAIKLGDEE